MCMNYMRLISILQQSTYSTTAYDRGNGSTVPDQNRLHTPSNTRYAHGQAELDRIRAKVRKTPEADGDARRRHLKRLSDERVRHWPNTLEAQRQNKVGQLSDCAHWYYLYSSSAFYSWQTHCSLGRANSDRRNFRNLMGQKERDLFLY